MWDRFGCFQVERYILHELYTLDQTAREAFSSYQFNRGKLFRCACTVPRVRLIVTVQHSVSSLSSSFDFLEFYSFFILFRRHERYPLRRLSIFTRTSASRLYPAKSELPLSQSPIRFACTCDSLRSFTSRFSIPIFPFFLL